jgi:hypothetical protein
VAERSLTPPPWNGTATNSRPRPFHRRRSLRRSEDVVSPFLTRGSEASGHTRSARLRLTSCAASAGCPGQTLCPAGQRRPTISTEDGQMQGAHVRISLTTYRDNWRGQPGDGAQFRLPAARLHERTRARRPRCAPRRSPRRRPTAMTRSDVDGAPIVRVYNASEPGRSGAFGARNRSRYRPRRPVEHVHTVVPPGDWRFPPAPRKSPPSDSATAGPGRSISEIEM